jgi:hypothetical protein
MTLIGKVENGKITPLDPIQWAISLNKLAGKEVEIEITQRRNNRTINQNKYYWACVIAVTSALYGYYPDEMHRAWANEFLSELDVKTGLTRIKSTTKLTTEEFNQYIDRIGQKAAQDFPGAAIPPPAGSEYTFSPKAT